MNTENLAERLFCDLKNIGIKIEPAKYIVEGAKIGQLEINPNTGLLSELRQLVIFGKANNTGFGFCFGPATNDEYNLTFTEAYNKLLEVIISYKHVKFYSLVIPTRGVLEVKLLEFETVVGRYIKDYLPFTDETMIRWDFMVQELNSNAQTI